MRLDLSKFKNAGHFKLGYRPDFLKTNIELGRKRIIILPNGKKHESLFAIVELDQILPSNNYKNFRTTTNYPTTEDGRNLNDRNYIDDKNAQKKVLDVARALSPALIISTSADSEGTPVISIDGVVVSGNNRVMSLQMARDRFPENYDKYKDVLKTELAWGGYGDGINGYTLTNFDNPVLVRIDLDFESYLTEELNQFNVASKKSERNIDKAIRISQQLKDNVECQRQLSSIANQDVDSLSKIYDKADNVVQIKNILLRCNLINENQIAQYFDGRELSGEGKDLFEVIMSSLVLNPTALKISQSTGVKEPTKRIVRSIVPLIESGDTLKSEINNALVLQYQLKQKKFDNILDFIVERELFEKNPNLTFEGAVLNYWINQSGIKFKNLVIKYNNQIKQYETENLFGETKSPAESFYQVFVEELPELVKLAILRVFKPDLASIEEESLILEKLIERSPENASKLKPILSDMQSTKFLFI